jgi:hypothetical protein
MEKLAEDTNPFHKPEYFLLSSAFPKWLTTDEKRAPYGKLGGIFQIVEVLV